MRTRAVTIGILAVVGCGGRLEAIGGTGGSLAPGAVEAGAPVADAGVAVVDAAESEDPAPSCPEDTGPFVCDTDAIPACIALAVSAEWGPPVGATRFLRLQDLLAYFKDVAEQYTLVIPAHYIDCAPPVLACDWNPTTARLDATDVHYSNAWHEFTSANGDPMVWFFVPSQNEWLFVDGVLNPSLYQLIVDENACLFGPLDAASD